MEQFTCGFIGLGLIGGSIAKAIRRAMPDVRIIACDVNASALALACREGVCDRALPSVSGELSACDLIFLCAPVSCNEENLEKLRPFLKKDALLTDVGSVKTGIHKKVRDAGLDAQFIGGHPMTGSERFGYSVSKAELLENAYYILTPSLGVPEEKLRQMTGLVRAIGAIPLVLDAGTHDFVTAGVSHLPHVIATALVHLVRENDGAGGVMKQIAAGGFKDITRIASSSPGMWQQICLSNTDNILTLLDRYQASLAQVRELLARRDAEALYRFFDEGRAYRDSFPDASGGSLPKSFALYVDIPDKPGSLALIASLLAERQISIKNIGIVHNREAEEGVLRIEFWEESAIADAAALLSEQGYAPFLRR